VEKLRDALRPVPMPADLLDLGCLPGTRTEVLSGIIAWLDDQSESNSNVLWLCGAPGTGKTTVSWSLIAELRRQQRCAGIFLFRQEEDSPSELWRTLAYEIARFHPAIESEIYDAATRTNNKLDLNNVKITFEKLIKDPLEATEIALSDHSPVLLIGALEKCSQDESRKMLLRTLSQWPSLPRHCKLIITSQPQSDILDVLEGESIKRMDLSMEDGDNSATTKDIRTYIKHRFAEIRGIDDGWPDLRAISKMVEHANGFFKWAAVAMDDISSTSAEEREKRLLAIIESGSATDFDSLNEYFWYTLETTVGHPSFRTFRATMGAVFFSKESLSMRDLHRFLQESSDTTENVKVKTQDKEGCFASSKDRVLTKNTLYKLSPLMTFGDDEDKVVGLRHKAYRDYLVDPLRCPSSWFIDKGKAHRRMTVKNSLLLTRSVVLIQGKEGGCLKAGD
jgi:Cdc6-like AAA superfamily ATPase